MRHSHIVQIEVHFNPYVMHVHWVVHSILQPHLIIFRSSCGTGGFVIFTGRHIPFDIFHSHCSGGKSFPHQLWTKWQTLSECFAFHLRWVQVHPSELGPIHCLLFLCGSGYGKHKLFACIYYTAFVRRMVKKMVVNFWNWFLFRYFYKTADFPTEWMRDTCHILRRHDSLECYGISHL